MASGASHAFGDVNTMIEVDEVWYGVHARPGKRRGIAIAGSYRLKYGGVGPNLRVARHTGLCWGHACGGGHFHRSMAVPAIQSEFAYMVLVAEWHRLGPRVMHLGYVGRIISYV